MSESPKLDAIRTPLSRRWFLMRRRVLPAAVWVMAVLAAAILLGRDPASLDATGMVTLREIPLAPVVDARVQRVTVGLFDEVTTGQVVAQLDDTLVSAELLAAEAEYARLLAEVAAERERIAQEVSELARDALNNERVLVMSQMSAQLDVLDREAQYETDRTTMQGLASLLERQEALARERLIDQATLDETRMQYETIRMQVQESAAAREAAAEQLRKATALREAKAPDVVLAQEDLVLAPLRAAVTVQQALVQALRAERDSLVLTSPVDGRVASILREPGSTATPELPVLTVTAAGDGQVVAYVPERIARDIAVGTPVRVTSRRTPRHVAEAAVVKINPQIAPYPLQLQPNVNMLQWGLPLLIGPVPKDFLPGEVVYVRFLGDKRAGTGVWNR